jgi:hypothetical protein
MHSRAKQINKHKNFGEGKNFEWDNFNLVYPTKLFSSSNIDFSNFSYYFYHFKVETLFSYATNTPSLSTKIGKMKKSKCGRIDSTITLAKIVSIVMD